MNLPALTEHAQDAALAIIATWIGPRMGYDGPAPTGFDAASAACGPMLARTWDWPSAGPTPTVLLEGGPDEWAIYASLDDTVVAALAAIGVHAEPYAAYALCLYPLNTDPIVIPTAEPDLRQWRVTGGSMVVEAATEAEAIDRAQDSSGWSWEAEPVTAPSDGAAPADAAAFVESTRAALASEAAQDGDLDTVALLDEALALIVSLSTPTSPAPLVEVLNVRDSDATSVIRAWIDGAELRPGINPMTVQDVDPGAGYSLSEWRAETKELRASTELSPSFAQAVASARDDAESSEFIDDDTALDRHSNDLGDWCPYSGEPAAEDGGCPQGCREARPDEDDAEGEADED